MESWRVLEAAERTRGDGGAAPEAAGAQAQGVPPDAVGGDPLGAARGCFWALVFSIPFDVAIALAIVVMARH